MSDSAQHLRLRKKCLVCHGEKSRHYVEVHQWMNMLWTTYLHHHTVAVHIVHYDKKVLFDVAYRWVASKKTVVYAQCAMTLFYCWQKLAKCHDLNCNLMTLWWTHCDFFTSKRVSKHNDFHLWETCKFKFWSDWEIYLSWYLKYFQRWLLATGLRISMSC